MISTPATFSWPLRWLAEIAAGVRFFSRIGLPSLGRFDRPDQPPSFGLVVRRMGPASIIILAPGAALVLLLSALQVPTWATAAVVVIFTCLVTGALHEDGLGDVADGFGGGRDRDAKLEIMRDSRIGTYGVVAICGSILVRTACLAALIAHSPWLAAMAWMTAGTLARSTSILPWISLPPARREGASATIPAPSVPDFVVGMLTALVVTLPLCGLLLTPAAALVAFMVSWTTANWARSQIGGHTGDVIGASEQLAECAALMTLATLASALI